MDELCLKTDLTEVAYSGNDQSKVGDLVRQLLIIFMFDSSGLQKLCACKWCYACIKIRAWY